MSYTIAYDADGIRSLHVDSSDYSNALSKFFGISYEYAKIMQDNGTETAVKLFGRKDSVRNLSKYLNSPPRIIGGRTPSFEIYTHFGGNNIQHKFFSTEDRADRYWGDADKQYAMILVESQNNDVVRSHYSNQGAYRKLLAYSHAEL